MNGTDMTEQHCQLCGDVMVARRFSRRGYLDTSFCSVTCVEAFEIRAGLPNGRIYESRPGWSPFPAIATRPLGLAC